MPSAERDDRDLCPRVPLKNRVALENFNSKLIGGGERIIHLLRDNEEAKWNWKEEGRAAAASCSFLLSFLPS